MITDHYQSNNKNFSILLSNSSYHMKPWVAEIHFD